MKLRFFQPRLIAAAALLLVASGARADITAFTSRTAFSGALASSGTDTYNDLEPNQWYPSLNRTAGAYSYTASGSAMVLYGAGTADDPWLTSNYATASIIFSNFSGNVNAFGGNFFGTDIWGSLQPHMSLTLVANDGGILEYTLGDTDTTSFLGFVSTSPLVSVTLHNDGSNLYWPTANNVTLGVAMPVPEPGTYAMLLAGLSLVSVAARRRR